MVGIGITVGCIVSFGGKREAGDTTGIVQLGRKQKGEEMPKCVNCGKDVVPVKPKFNTVGCLLISLVSVLLLSIPYLIWWATRPADVCPACGEKVYEVTIKGILK